MLREELERYAGESREAALRSVLAPEHAITSTEPYVWDREEIYRERLDNIVKPR